MHFIAHFLADQDEIWCGIEAVQVKCPDST